MDILLIGNPDTMGLTALAHSVLDTQYADIHVITPEQAKEHGFEAGILQELVRREPWPIESIRKRPNEDKKPSHRRSYKYHQ